MDRDLDTSFDGRDLPEGWVVWSDEEGVVVVYKPDVFNASNYPRPCLPVITITKASSGSIGGREGWRVTFYIESDVEAFDLKQTVPEFDDAVDYLVDIASDFNSGEFEIRDFYAEGDVREDYVEALEKEIEG